MALQDQPAVLYSGVCLDDQDGSLRTRPTLEMVKKEITNRDAMFIPVRERGRERGREGGREGGGGGGGKGVGMEGGGGGGGEGGGREGRAEREDWEE